MNWLRHSERRSHVYKQKLIKTHCCLSSLCVPAEDKHLLFAVKNRAAGDTDASKATDRRQSALAEHNYQ